MTHRTAPTSIHRSTLPEPLEAEIVAATADELSQRIARLAYSFEPGRFFNFDQARELREVRDLLEALAIWADEVQA